MKKQARNDRLKARFEAVGIPHLEPAQILRLDESLAARNREKKAKIQISKGRRI